MTDYGRSVTFGVFPVPTAADLEGLWEVVHIADTSGLDLIGIQDHPYQRRFLDTMALLSAVAERTERVSVFPDVVNLPLRQPAMLAKAAATIDLLSGGRFELGLGAGAFWDAIASMGGPRRTPGESLQALSEAIEVIRLMWSQERSVRYNGEHYRLSGVKPGPAPSHDVSIWLGVGGPRALRLLGEVADGWIPSIPLMPVAELVPRHAIIDEAAMSVGRNPVDIRRLANINGVITDGESDGFLQGPVGQWVDQLTDLVVHHGIDTFIFWPDGDPVQQTHRYAEITDQVRAGVAAARQ